jgi:hypothetical protein
MLFVRGLRGTEFDVQEAYSGRLGGLHDRDIVLDTVS